MQMWQLELDIWFDFQKKKILFMFRFYSEYFLHPTNISTTKISLKRTQIELMLHFVMQKFIAVKINNIFLLFMSEKYSYIWNKKKI